MTLQLLAVLTATAALTASAHFEAKSDAVSRYTNLSQCKDVDRPPPGEDWVYFRCAGLGGLHVWYVCMDSARCRYGFGVKPNVSGMFGTSDGSWPIEWRGVQRKGRFAPFSVIARMPSADPDASVQNSLIIFRLRADGTSCIVGEATSNEDARKIADGSAGKFRCVAEPDLL